MNDIVEELRKVLDEGPLDTKNSCQDSDRLLPSDQPSICGRCQYMIDPSLPGGDLLRLQSSEPGIRSIHLPISRMPHGSCQFCALILQAIWKAAGMPKLINGSESFEYSRQRVLGNSAYITSSNRWTCFEYDTESKFLKVGVRNMDADKKEPPIWFAKLYLYQLPESQDCSPEIPRHPHLPRRTDHVDVIQSVASWLFKCATEHNHPHVFYNRSIPFVPPGRLLEITEDANAVKVRLFEMNPSEINIEFIFYSGYIALSHRWGSGPMIVTNRANLESHYTGINIDALPQTFKDAITVCRALHVPFLWIDSLCIVQDDPNDWEREAAKMGHVFANAMCTIAAAAADDNSEGFLRPRSLCPPIKLGAPHQLLYATDALPLEEELQYNALCRRAWVMQERLLPYRIIHFTKSQVYFECHGNVYQEVGVGRPDDRYIQGIISEFDVTVSSTSRMPFAWEAFIIEYSCCDITYETDRLPAIAGLAMRMQTRLSSAIEGYRYYYGVWEKDLIRDLVWMDRGAPYRRKPAERWHAPSWSWAAHNGGVLFMGTQEIIEHMKILELPPGAFFVDQTTKRAPLKVRARMCRMPGVLHRMVEFRSGAEDLDRSVWRDTEYQCLYQDLGGEDYKFSGSVAFDVGFDEDGGVKIARYSGDTGLYCAHVFNDTGKMADLPDHSPEAYFLALQPTENPLEFIRVGAGAAGCKENWGWLMDDATETEFIIL